MFTKQKYPLQGPCGFTVSPDGRRVLFAQADQSISDIMLVEDRNVLVATTGPRSMKGDVKNKLTPLSAGKKENVFGRQLRNP